MRGEETCWELRTAEGTEKEPSLEQGGQLNYERINSSLEDKIRYNATPGSLRDLFQSCFNNLYRTVISQSPEELLNSHLWTGEGSRHGQASSLHSLLAACTNPCHILGVDYMDADYETTILTLKPRKKVVKTSPV